MKRGDICPSLMWFKCIYCGDIYRYFDGRGVAGQSSGICPKCKSEGKTIFVEAEA